MKKHSVIIYGLICGLLRQCLCEAVQLDCTGCISSPAEVEYYCPNRNQLFYFRCEILESPGLTWKVSPFFQNSILLSINSERDNIIRVGPVTIIVDDIKVFDGEEVANFSSHLWIDFREANNINISVSCGQQSLNDQTKEMIPLGELLPPNNVSGVASILNNMTDTSMEYFVFYEWSHPNPGQVLFYDTEILLNEEIIHKMKVPGEITNSSCRLRPLMNNMEYILNVTAIDRCGQQRAKHTTISITDSSLCDVSTREPSNKSEGSSMTEALFFILFIMLCSSYLFFY